MKVSKPKKVKKYNKKLISAHKRAALMLDKARALIDEVQDIILLTKDEEN